MTRHTAQVRSEIDGHYHTISAETLADWEGAPSLSFLGKGHYVEDLASNQSYYREIYRGGQVKRIFCHEHSGLLSRKVRDAGAGLDGRHG